MAHGCSVYDQVKFRNGWATNAPEMFIEFKGIRREGTGPSAEYGIRLGRILSIKRWRVTARNGRLLQVVLSFFRLNNRARQSQTKNIAPVREILTVGRGHASMSKLEELTPNASVRGILPNALITVVSLQWHGSEAVELTYKTPEGKVANELLYRDDEPRIEVVEQGRPWSFDGDGELFRLVSEAQRIRLAHLFDPA